MSLPIICLVIDYARRLQDLAAEDGYLLSLALTDDWWKHRLRERV